MIDLLFPGEHMVHRRIDIFFLRYIAGDEMRVLIDWRVNIEVINSAALLLKVCAGGFADTGGSTGDDGDFILKFHCLLILDKYDSRGFAILFFQIDLCPGQAIILIHLLVCNLIKGGPKFRPPL